MALIFLQIQSMFAKDTPSISIIKFAIKPSIIGAMLLAFIYLGFAYRGAHYATLIANVEPQLMLSIIALNTMGNKAAIFIGLVVSFSCLTTGVALNNIYDHYSN